MLKFTQVVLLLFGPMVFAQGAVRFKSLEQAQRAGFYRITCSDPKSEIQAHVFIEIDHQKLTELKVLTIANAESLGVVHFSANELKNFKLEETQKHLRISGERPDSYFTEELELNLSQQGDTFEASFYYNDHDGMTVDRKAMPCGIVNYLLSPSQ